MEIRNNIADSTLATQVQSPARISRTDIPGGLDRSGTKSTDFKNLLRDQLSPVGSKGNSEAARPALKFSNHAAERMVTRGIKMEPADFSRLSAAVDKVAAKGSQNSLVLMNDSAFVVSVKNGTVVTVMDKNNLKDNVFTQIDSTIVV